MNLKIKNNIIKAKLRNLILIIIINLLFVHVSLATPVRINIGSEPGTLDWNLATDSSSFQIINNIMGGLTKFNENLKLEPNLAESWVVNKEEKKITIRIKDGIQWSDGKKLTSKHFIDSWERLLNPQTGADYAYFLYDIKNAKEYNLGIINDFQMVGVKSVNSETIEIYLNENKSYFMSLLSFMSTFPIRIDNIKKNKEDWVLPQNILTLGEYKLTKWESHNYILLEPKNKNFQSILLLMNDNPSSSLAMFQNGKLDIIDGGGIPLLEIPYLKSKKLLNFETQFRNNYIGFNVEKPPFNIKEIRQAFSLSINKSVFQKVLYNTVIETESWIPPGLIGNIHKNKPRYNKELANKLLDENGYKNRKDLPKIKFLFPESGNNRIIAEILQTMWMENLGVKVDIQGLEWKIYLITLDIDRPNMFRAGWAADYPDPHNFMNIFTCNGGNNETGWCNSEYDKKINLASFETSKEKRKELYVQAQNQLLYDENVIIPLFLSNQIYLKNDRIKNLNFSKMGIIDFTKIKVISKN